MEKRKVKRLKLRPIWWGVLTILVGCLLGIVLIAWLKDINKKAVQCESVTGRACTYYEIRQTTIHK